MGERRSRPRVGVVSGAIRAALTYSCTRTVFLRILDGHLMLHVDSIGVMELGRQTGMVWCDAGTARRVRCLLNTNVTYCSLDSSLILIHPVPSPNSP